MSNINVTIDDKPIQVSVVGGIGPSAYDIAVANGFTGTIAQFIATGGGMVDSIENFALNITVPYSDLATKFVQLQNLVLGSVTPVGSDYSATYAGYKATTALMAAIPAPFANQPVLVTDSTTGGIFIWKTGNYTARVNADTAHYYFVASTTIPTVNGAWVRLVVNSGNSVANIGLAINASTRMIHSGVGLVETSGYRTVNVGVGRYKRDDTLVTAAFASAHPVWTFLATDELGNTTGWYLVPNDDGAVRFDAFGAYCDSRTSTGILNVSAHDDFPAWTALRDFYTMTAQQTAQHNYYRKLTPTRFSAGAYRFNSRNEIKEGSPTFLGDGNAYSLYGGGTFFEYAKNIGGLIVHNESSSGEGGTIATYPNGRGTYGGLIQDIHFISMGGTSTHHYGLWVRGFCHLKNLAATQWDSDGIVIWGEPIGSSSGETIGGVDSMYAENLLSAFNNGSGFRVEGSEANAGLFLNLQGLNNGQWGLVEKSGIANTYIGGQMDGNGYGGNGRTVDTGPSLLSSQAYYAGNIYGVVYGQEAAASTTIPGTNSAVWYLISTGAANPPYTPTWTSGMTWRTGGALVVASYAPCPFIGMYVEGGQGLIQNFGGRATFTSGIGAQSVLYGRGVLTADTGGVVVMYGGVKVGGLPNPDSTYGDTNVTIGGGGTGQGMQQVLRQLNSIVAPNGFNWTFDFSLKQLILRYGGADPGIMSIIGPNSTRYFGRSSPMVNPALHAIRLWIGVGENAREMGRISAIGDLSGQQVAQGDIYWKINPTPSSSPGWIVTTAGVVGAGTSPALFSPLPALGAAVSA